MRRGAGLDPGRLDRLQPVGTRPDRTAVGRPAAADPDQRIPAAALARSVAAELGRRRVQDTRADFTEVRDVISVAVTEDRSIGTTVLFDPDQSLSERIIVEQFTV